MSTDARKTKIVCTLGPASDSTEGIGNLIQAGMDVARLNFSHGDLDSHRETIRNIRRISSEMGREVGILQDLGGPKIRLGDLPGGAMEIEAGEEITLSPMEAIVPTAIPVRYPYIVGDVNQGDRILLADGLVELRVELKEEDRLICRVVVGGILHSRKGVNLPSSRLRIPAFTEKDRQDLTLGIEEGVDFVALSFVRHENDLSQIRDMMARSKSRPLLIAKIEKPQAMERLHHILLHVDGVMVARGDLGVEMPLEEVPMIQKKIIHAARRSGRPVITATQMLRSMVNNPRPTRAEAADVANAILDGTDAVMLSEETAMGEYPVTAVHVLDRIAGETEKHLQERDYLGETGSDILPVIESAISRAACILAEDMHASAIVACTTSGSTARLVSRFRSPRPVIGLTHRAKTQRQLNLSWGVIPLLVESFTDTDHMFELAKSLVNREGLAGKGDRLIITAGVPVGSPGTTNMLKVIELEGT
ncbi:MAG: pyruvate kinase [Deltaproteobacteria bacterium]|nr:pyruvate kinase [Deltaproteobacteria bacterium]